MSVFRNLLPGISYRVGTKDLFGGTAFQGAARAVSNINRKRSILSVALAYPTNRIGGQCDSYLNMHPTLLMKHGVIVTAPWTSKVNT